MESWPDDQVQWYSLTRCAGIIVYKGSAIPFEVREEDGRVATSQNLSKDRRYTALWMEASTEAKVADLEVMAKKATQSS